MLGLLAATLYLLTLSNDPSADSLIFALDIESGEMSRLLDPTHLALHPLGLGFYRLWQIFGWEYGAWRPSQVVNALAGAAAVALLFAIALVLTRSRAIALVVALGFAFSGGPWLLSVEAEYVTPALAVVLFLLALVLRLEKEPSLHIHYKDSILFALATLLATLFYANSLFVLVPVVSFGYWLLAHSPRPTRIRHILVYLGAVVACFCPYWPWRSLALVWPAATCLRW